MLSKNNEKEFWYGVAFVVFILTCIVWFFQGRAYADGESKKGKTYTIKIKASAYCEGECCCGAYADGYTATGTTASKAGIAVDPKLIPLGSTITLPDGTKLKADDVGGAIKGKRIDIRVVGENAHYRAYRHKYSQKWITITVEEPSK